MIDKIVLRVLKKSILLNFCPDQQAKANKPRVGGSTLDNQEQSITSRHCVQRLLFIIDLLCIDLLISGYTS